MIKKCLILMFGLSAIANVNAGHNYSYVIDLEDVSPFFYNAGRMPDRVCGNGFLATDIKSKPNHYDIKVNMPGIDKKDVKVTFKESTLHIKVNMPKDDKSSDEYILKERHVTNGEASRSFKLRDADMDGDIKVKLKDGILEIKVPKNQKKSAREIKVM